MKAKHEEMVEFEKKSNKKYSGYAHLYILDGKEYYIDGSDAKRAEELGAKKSPILLIYGS